MSEWIVRGVKRSGGNYPSRCYEKVQKLVRCRVCAHWDPPRYFCKQFMVGTPWDGFCYMGEMSEIPTGSEKPNNSERSSDA